ncbi:F-box/FBD/LRR-repeat protein At2g04230-like [Tasmannia lanceolata]|uniref:F-box/FBD/LRR-repeat protein At2g04230-like n=1 Tax=Tasmannia lanceolata TaxID=3420 RepID=UPI0040632108
MFLLVTESSRQETSSRGIEEQNHDQISHLPDFILCHILSFMPMKNAVKTGILSTKWRDLWTWVSTLDFQYRQFADRGRMDFINFVDRSLILYNGSNIRRFHLSFDCDERFASYMDVWIRFAVRRQVEELDLDLDEEVAAHNPYDHRYMLPHCLYNNLKLTYLRLRCCNIKLNDFICWRSLKVISLEDVQLEKESFHLILSGCPLLEDLVMVQCRIWSQLNNSTPNLKSLTVKYFDGRLIISAPKLRSLNICGFLDSTAFSLTNFSLSLHEVILMS